MSKREKEPDNHESFEAVFYVTIALILAASVFAVVAQYLGWFH